MKKPQYKNGQQVEVLCHISAKRSCEWIKGRVIGVISATDIPYRIDVEINGAALTGHAAAHPDCVRPLEAERIA